MLNVLPKFRKAAQNPLVGPLRGELLGLDQLAERARVVARAQVLNTSPKRMRGAPLLARLNETRQVLDAAQARIAASADAGTDIGPAGAWLLDNFHVVNEHIREVKASMPGGYYRELPELANGRLAGYPRVYEVAITLISHSDGRIDPENVGVFVAAFQEERPLSLGELWAMPAMLRLGLLESVRRMALRTIQRLADVEEADRRVERIQQASAQRTAELDAVLHDFVRNPPPLTATFVSRFINRLRESADVTTPLTSLERWITRQAFNAEVAGMLAMQRVAMTQVVMANSITSLRVIARLNWQKFVERQSVTERELRLDPAGFYARMTFETRDRYRHIIERIAKRTGRTEPAVATAVVELAASAPAQSRHSHIGYYLIDDGLPALEQTLGYRRTARESVLRFALTHPNLVFFGAITLFTVILLWAALRFMGAPAWAAWPIVVLFTLLPAIDIAVNAVNQLLTVLLPPHRMPKLDLREHKGVLPELRTAVVTPTLFPDVDAVREAIETIEMQYLANREANLHFALLSDFTDADAETKPGDEEIVAAAIAGIDALNERYAPAQRDVFYLFHRPRRWNPAEGVWMGWERKRGKLAEFNRFLRAGASPAFSAIAGNVENMQHVRYVITLDADTVLPPNGALLLIGALAHPLNRAIYDPAAGRVVQGFGIVQPRVGVSLPSAQQSRFAAIFSGHPGVDPYTTAVSDVYQDLFGEGSFTGKAIYDVDIFEQATHGRFPENSLLSHDLIEGNYARAGLATDIAVYDDYPTQYLTYTRRKHRWIRGDWQLLPWLRRRVTGPQGKERNRLSMLSRWKILDNLRRSTTEIAQLALFIAGWLWLPGSPVRWTLLAVGAVAAPWVLAVILAALQPPRDKSWRAYYAAVGRDAANSAQQFVLSLIFLVHQAWISADGIIRTLWRLVVSKRHLLEWQTASLTERVATRSPGAVRRQLAPAIAVPVLLLIAVAALAGTAALHAPLLPLVLAMTPLVIAWLHAPSIAYQLGEPPADLQRLPAEHRAEALRYAQLHWSYFDEFANGRTHALIPDNFQEDPEPIIAMRTSPTNIGLQLLCTVSAFDLGFITADDMTRRLENTFATLGRLARYRGHFYNWYSLEDLSVLEPAYISTVDSGNLAAHFIALRQALLEHTDSPRLLALAEQAYAYALEMDFRFLFDETRKLFAIGYARGSHSLDASHYDLLASESRLASFLAIAKSDVPVEHWFQLGRTITYAAGASALVSWSGSMFEYLMPILVMRSMPMTLLDQTMRGAVQRQIAYGAVHGVPWGISESAYAVRDRHATYQYRGFGVPDLALKHGLDRDLVIAPYASALALAVEPRAALRNLARLDDAGALGPYGFRDALDFTRTPPGERFTLVGAFMAHHIGMSLVALTNAILDDVWQKRFHADPLVRSAELLLHERIPRRLVIQEPQPEHVPVVNPDDDLEQPSVREYETVDTPLPHVALLGQLPYTVMITQDGGGYSRFEGLAVTRWRSDATSDDTGQFCYVSDVKRGHTWSVAHQPCCTPADWYRAQLATDRVTFHRADGAIETRTEITIVPEDSAEVRRVTVTNNSDETREVELTSYGEVVLSPPEAERAHPAFANLFVETAYHEWCTAITAKRRPRTGQERPLICVHVVATGKERVGPVTCETDRSRFIGRGRTTRDPLALDEGGALSGTTGAVLDPVFALRTRVRLRAGQSAQVAFTTLVAADNARAYQLADRYHNLHAAQRALDLAWTSTHIELRELSITPAESAIYQELAGHLLYAGSALGASADEQMRSRSSQPQLWANGISGDRPILLALIDSTDGLPTLRQAFTAHHYWRRRGLHIDLVVLNQRAASYLQELDDAIVAALAASSDAGMLDQPGGVFMRRRDLITEEALATLRAVARVHVECNGQSLSRLLEDPPMPRAAKPQVATLATQRPVERQESRATYAQRRARRSAANPSAGHAAQPVTRRWSDAPQPDPVRVSLNFENGFGGVDADHDYHIRVRGDFLPPAPWANVIANQQGGFMITERGGGFTWAENSYFFRLTPWQNDPVSDQHGEVIYLQDDESGVSWCPTPGPLASGEAYDIRHSAGASFFHHIHEGITTELTVGMAPDSAVKLSILSVTNNEKRPRRLTLTAYAEWTLGVLREQSEQHIRTRFAAEHGAIFATNAFDPLFADMVCFCGLSDVVTAFTGDRREFIGRNGTLADPAALRADAMSGATGAGLDPCAALQCSLVLEPGETRELVVFLGAARGEHAAYDAITRLRPTAAARAAVQQSVAEWQQRLSVITVRTPEPAFDAMVNRWTLYQALACRMWARSALYQSSGAYGFRDQLQDVMAFVYAEPHVAREHILRAAARQFTEGDVQHWWHPHSGRGVRTRFSDDLAWLPYVVEHYVRVSGDAGVLDESVPFLSMRVLQPDEHEVYDLPARSNESASVYEHCVRALRKACTTGVHGLPLIGVGDWNDGMNRVGLEGKGESVWLAWFLIVTLRRFADLAETRAAATATEFRAQADAYVQAVEREGWDGSWYRRAYFDDGTPLGSAQNEECRIDAIAQSWSVISGAGSAERRDRAIRSLDENLIDNEARIMALLKPPFDKTPMDPGYIKGYLPGVRENGAQYTHAALWTVLATALHGDTDRAFELYQMINPLTRTDTPEGVATYKVEPYVVAADVYAAEGHVGRGGWTWYTGSASWMYRIGLETILGFSKRGDTLSIMPNVPSGWQSYQIDYRFGRTMYRITVKLVDNQEGAALANDPIQLIDDGNDRDIVLEVQRRLTAELAEHAES